MPKDKDFKKLIRARMKKTGESYTTARARFLAKRDPGVKAAEYADVAGMSDQAVSAKTGRNWRQWVSVLDAVDAMTWTHRDIARHLVEEEGVGSWWAQTVTVAYERIRGLRDIGQRRGGGYDVNKSKTLPVPVEALYDAFQARLRRKWMGDVELTIRTSTRPKSMRITWEDGTHLDAYFWKKGPAKSQVQLQHKGLPDRKAADKVRSEWTTRLSALTDLLVD